MVFTRNQGSEWAGPEVSQGPYPISCRLLPAEPGTYQQTEHQRHMSARRPSSAPADTPPLPTPTGRVVLKRALTEGLLGSSTALL